MAETADAVAEKVEGPPAEAETTPKPEAELKEPAVDWAVEGPKERAAREEERAARLKVEQDFQSFKKGRLVAEEREETLNATRQLAEETRDIARANAAATRRLLEGDGNKEALAAFDKEQQEIAERRGKQTAEEKSKVALAKIVGVGTKLGLDVQADPVFSGAAAFYNQGRYAEAVVEVYETRDRILAERAEQEKAKEAEPPKPKAEPKRTMTDIGRGSGGQGPRVTSENIDSLWLKFDREHPNEPNPYSNQYREVLKR